MELSKLLFSENNSDTQSKTTETGLPPYPRNFGYTENFRLQRFRKSVHSTKGGNPRLYRNTSRCLDSGRTITGSNLKFKNASNCGHCRTAPTR